MVGEGHSALMKSAMRSAIAMTVRFRFARTVSGMIDASAIEDDLVNETLGHDGQARSAAGGVEIGNCRAQANALRDVEGQRADAGRAGPVVVGAVSES